MPKVIGIDLGTTTSCVAVIENGRPVIIPSREGLRLTPSIVAFTKDGTRLVGEMARRQAILNPEHTVFSIKRLMGRKYDDPVIARDRHLLPYKVMRASNGDAWVDIEGRHYSPPEISAMILQKLKADAEAYLGEQVREVVITVPAYFNDSQRQATRDAAKIAGLHVLWIINEPTAASLAYGLQRKKDERILVYDLGGGSFDVSILECGDGLFEVRSTNGDTHLGGDDFDQRLITWLADTFSKKHSIDLRQDRLALQRLKEAAENAKKELSSVMQIEINLPFIAADASGPKHLTMMLTRAKLEQLVDDLIKRSRGPVMKALSDAHMRPGDINEVILVGDQTRMPAVRALVRSIFGREPNHRVNPDEAVAFGAAIQAGVLMGNVKDVLLLDVTPFSLGIATVGGVFTRLIERNTTIPTQKSMILLTTSDNQSSMKIDVLQGERKFAKDNLLLGTFTLDGILPAKRGVPQIEVTLDLNANGIMTVSARDKGTGRQQKIMVASSGLSKDRVDRMVRDAELYAMEDKKHQEEVEEHNLADSVAYRAEKSVAELGDMLTIEQKSELESKVTDVRSARSRGDVARIRAAREALDDAFQRLLGDGEALGKRGDVHAVVPTPQGESNIEEQKPDLSHFMVTVVDKMYAFGVRTGNEFLILKGNMTLQESVHLLKDLSTGNIAVEELVTNASPLRTVDLRSLGPMESALEVSTDQWKWKQQKSEASIGFRGTLRICVKHKDAALFFSGGGVWLIIGEHQSSCAYEPASIMRATQMLSWTEAQLYEMVYEQFLSIDPRSLSEEMRQIMDDCAQYLEIGPNSRVEEQEPLRTFNTVRTKDVVEATDALFNQALLAVPVMPRRAITLAYRSIRHAWASQALYSGTQQAMREIVYQYLQQLKCGPGFATFRVDAEPDDRVPYAQVNTIYQYTFVGICLWRSSDHIFVCGNATLEGPQEAVFEVISPGVGSPVYVAEVLEKHALPEIMLSLSAYRSHLGHLPIARLVVELSGIGRTAGYLRFEGDLTNFEAGHNVRAKEIGEELNRRGGFPLMLSAYEQIVAELGRVVGRELEAAWDGVGEWRG